MSIQTLDIEKLNKDTGNQYELIAIMSKRSRQIAAREKLEIDEKLKYFEGFEDEDEFTFNEEQENISREFEKLTHPTQRAIEEMREGEVYFRYPETEE
jgi:DNA-directed RNA polymerase subunit K/omega